MTFGKTALRCWLPAAALLLALLCPLPVAAARAGTAIPVSVRTDGAAADAVYTVELTPLDAAPAPVQRALTVKNGGTVYFTASPLTSRGITGIWLPSAAAALPTRPTIRTATRSRSG